MQCTKMQKIARCAFPHSALGRMAANGRWTANIERDLTRYLHRSYAWCA